MSHKYIPITYSSSTGFDSNIIVKAFKDVSLLKKYGIGPEFNTNKHNILDSIQILDEYKNEILTIASGIKQFKDSDIDFNKIKNIANRNYLLSLYLNYQHNQIPIYCYNTQRFKIEKSLSSGIQGSTFKSSINGYPFVIKYNSSRKFKEDTIRESAVGSVLNLLYERTPNFMYFYGLFNCSMLIDDSDLTGINICEDYEYPGYGVFEYIEGKTLTNTVKYLNINEMINIYCQILLSLYIAYSKFKYTHYDLHTSNIMIIEYDKEIDVYYYLPNRQMISWKTKYLAKIIDYGNSYLEYKNKKIFKDGAYLSSKNGQSNQPNHQFDFIRLAINLYFKSNNNKIFLEAIKHIINVSNPYQLVLLRLPYFNVNLDKDDINNSALSVFDKLYSHLNVSIIDNFEIDNDIPLSVFTPKQERYIEKLCASNRDRMKYYRNKIYLEPKDKITNIKDYMTQYEKEVNKQIDKINKEYQKVKDYIETISST